MWLRGIRCDRQRGIICRMQLGQRGGKMVLRSTLVLVGSCVFALGPAAVLGSYEARGLTLAGFLWGSCARLH
jgi:hypothetical protein